MKIIKRDGRAVDYDREKIKIAVEKANKEVYRRIRQKKNVSRRYSRHNRRKTNGNTQI